MNVIGRRPFAILSLVSWLVPAIASADRFQFEALGVSDDWIVVRENIPAEAADTNACIYPGLDPSEYVGARVHFVRLSAEAKRGCLVPLATPDSTMTLYPPGQFTVECAAVADAERRWHEITAHAEDLGIELPATPPVPLVLGTAVPAISCVLIQSPAAAEGVCRRIFQHVLNGVPIQIGVSLAAIPEAPDERVCQFVGHRFVAVIQISGPDFGDLGMPAPGGFAEHYDCRAQQFQPLRLYDLGTFAVVVGGFRGTSLADRDERPFLLVFPTGV